MSADFKKSFLSALRFPAFFLAAACSAVVCYYLIGAFLTHRIDLTVPKKEDFSDPRAAVAALIERETVEHVYTPGASAFKPAAVLDNMPAFQRGIIAAAARLTGSFSGDEACARAAALLTEPADGQLSLSSLGKAVALLRESAGKNGTTLSPTAVRAVVDDARERLLRHALRREMYFVDLRADDVFFFAKGELYTAYSALRATETDERTKDDVEEALFLLQKAFSLQPVIVLNVSPSSQFAPNHLAGAGFYAGGAAAALRKAEDKLR